MTYSNRPETPWAIICREHKQVFLTKREYEAQMSKPDSLWMCPLCGDNASWDDDNYEKHLDDDFSLEDEDKDETKRHPFLQMLEAEFGPVEVRQLTNQVYATDLSLPYIGYIYGHDGYHSGKNWLENEDSVKEFVQTKVKEAIKDKCEVTITNAGDEVVFHSKAGKILWPKT
jgi:hypothetical protein